MSLREPKLGLRVDREINKSTPDKISSMQILKEIYSVLAAIDENLAQLSSEISPILVPVEAEDGARAVVGVERIPIPQSGGSELAVELHGFHHALVRINDRIDFVRRRVEL